MKILMLDDDTGFTYDFPTMLKRDGHVVYSKVQPSGILDYVKEIEPDIIVTDYQMNEMNGLDVLNRLRENNIDIPVILCTGKAEIMSINLATIGDNESQSKLVIDSFGFSGYVSKLWRDCYVSLKKCINELSDTIDSDSK